MSPGAGITAGYDGTDETYRIFVSFFCGLAMYNAVELLIMIFPTFKRYQGLYFWSMLIAGSRAKLPEIYRVPRLVLARMK